ncbi:hypothetical protein CBL_12286 [Carabus blaptoides fortunei]
MSYYKVRTRGDGAWRTFRDNLIKHSEILNGGKTFPIHLLRENAILSEGSDSCEEVDSQWWQELDESADTILQRKAFENRNRFNSVDEKVIKTIDDFPTEDNDENVARKMIFTGRQRRSGNNRFSETFHLEQNRTNEPEVQVETDTYGNGEANNENNISAETVATTPESSKRENEA